MDSIAETKYQNAATARSKDRYRRIVLTSVSSTFAKAIAMVVSVVTVRVTLSYLGVERYGLWMTITSISAFLTFADFGMGNGLLNAISEANGLQDKDAAIRSVASVFYLLLGLATVGMLILLALHSIVPWRNVYNVRSPLATEEAGPASVAFVLLTLLSMPLSVVQRVQLGFQEGFQSGLWQTLGSILGLGGTLIVVRNRLDLTWLVVGSTGGPVVALLANGAHQFVIARPWIAPRFRDFSWATSRVLGRLGIQFFIIQIIGLVGFSTDTIILAQKVGPDAVAQYAVIQKLFAIAMGIEAVVFVPLWPAYAEAVARQDYEWVRRTLRLSFLACFGFSLVAAGPLIVFGKALILMWIKTPMPVSFSALCGFGAWLAIYGYAGTLTMLMNATNKLRTQIVCGTLFAIFSLSIKLFVAGKYGVAGVIWTTVATYAIFVVVPIWFVTRAILKNHTCLSSKHTLSNKCADWP